MSAIGSLLASVALTAGLVTVTKAVRRFRRFKARLKEQPTSSAPTHEPVIELELDDHEGVWRNRDDARS